MLLAGMVLAVYSRAASNGFINFDDPDYVVNNPHVQSGLTWATPRWSFFSYDGANWHPLAWLAHANLADALAREKRSDEAIVHFEEAERLHPYQPGEIMSLGMYEAQNGHWQAAISQFNRVLGSPDIKLRTAALNAMVQAYAQDGNWQLASDAYSRALQLDSEDLVALAGSRLVALHNNQESAAGQFSRLAQRRPSDVIFLLLAAALRQNGKRGEAEEAQGHAQRISRDWSRAQQIVDRLVNFQMSYLDPIPRDLGRKRGAH